MKKLIASVKDTYDNKIKIINGNDYNTKKEFAEDLRDNGFKVRFITTEENFDKDCAKYHERKERNRNIQNALYKSRKADAEKLNMTVRGYTNFCQYLNENK